MTTNDVLQAHELFARRPMSDRNKIFDCRVEIAGHPQLDVWPAAATAACRLSGALDECATDDDLDGALAEFVNYVNMGMASESDLEQATAEVVDDLLAWGEELERAGVAECAAATDSPACQAQYN